MTSFYRERNGSLERVRSYSQPDGRLMAQLGRDEANHCIVFIYNMG